MTVNSQNTKVVVIDDNRFSVRVLETGLTQLGIGVCGFTDPKDGLEYALENDVSVAAIDLVMEPLDGFEVLQAIKSKKPSTICIAMSASASDNDKDAAKQAGFDKLLVKPFNTEDLLDCLEGLINKRNTLITKNSNLSNSDSDEMRKQLDDAKAEFNQACLELDANKIMRACHSLRECAVLVRFPTIKASIEDIQQGISQRRLSQFEVTNVNQFIQSHLC